MAKMNHAPLMRLIIVVLAVVVVLQQYQIRILRTELCAASRLESPPKGTSAQLVTVATEPVVGQSQAVAVTTPQTGVGNIQGNPARPLAIANVPPAFPGSAVVAAPGTDPALEPADAAESPAAMMAEMMQNPAMKEMFRSNVKQQIDAAYGALFKALALPNKDQEAFKALLVEKMMSQLDLSMNLMNPEASAKNREDEQAKMKEIEEGFESDIKTVLGKENYANYKNFEDTMPERQQVELLKESLDESLALDDNAAKDLIKALHEERKNFKFALDLDQAEHLDPAKLTPEVLAQHTKDMERLQEICLLRAKGILTPPQLEQFKKNQEQQLKMQEMMLKMSAKALNKPKTAKPPETPAEK